MRLPWDKSKVEQLDLVDEASAELDLSPITAPADLVVDPQRAADVPDLSLDALAAEGVPLLIPVDSIEEDPGNPRTEFPDEELAELAQDISSLGVTFIFAEAADPAEFEVAVAKLFAERVDAIFPIGTAPLAGNLRVRLIELANQKRTPVIAGAAMYADAGALFIYDASVEDAMRRSAGLVDKVLKGAKPADTPVEQPNVFELVINLKAATALGITISRSILLRADRVIE